MQPQHQQSLPQPSSPSSPVVGDLGVIVVRSMLEAGVGMIVSSWLEAPTPIDAAVGDARDTLLAPRGVVLRRLAPSSRLQRLVERPEGGATRHPPRMVVVFAGRRGLVPALSRFVAGATAGGVVGLTFDDEAHGLDDAIVIDPVPTAAGISAAIRAGLEASVYAQRPALVVIRERALGMRGATRPGAWRTPSEAAESDARVRSEADAPMSPARAAARAGLLTTTIPADRDPGDERAPIIYAAGPLAGVVARACAHIDAALASARCAPVGADASIISNLAPGLLPPKDGTAAAQLGRAERVHVIAARAERVAGRLRSMLPAGVPVATTAIDVAHVRGEAVVSALARWFRDEVLQLEADSPGHAQLTRLIEAGRLDVFDPVELAGRVPARADSLRRSIPEPVAAALQLAQGVIGVPARLDPAWPTYRTDAGVPVTVVSAAVFARRAAGCAAPEAGAGVYVVAGATDSDVTAAAASMGATTELIDAAATRVLGAAIARAAAAPRVSPHVIVAVEQVRVAAPRRARLGFDPELIGRDRITGSILPADATALVSYEDHLSLGPSLVPLDVPRSHAVLDTVRELSAATWDLHVESSPPGRMGRLAWSAKRRLLRAAAGVDL